MASFGIVVPAISMALFVTRKLEGVRYLVACFEYISKYIAP